MRRRALVHPAHRPAALDDVRCVCAGHRPRPRRRAARLLLRRLLLRQADDGAVGDHVHRSVCGRQRRHAAQRSAAPDPALRSGRRGADPGRCCSRPSRAAGAFRDARSGCTCSSTPSRAIVIEIFRGDPRGAVGIFSTSQFISVILAPLSVVMLVYPGAARRSPSRGRRSRRRREPRPSTCTADERTASAWIGSWCRCWPSSHARRFNG